MGRINLSYEDDLSDEGILPLLKDKIIFPPEGLFMRLNACSAKDGVKDTDRRTAALHSVKSLLLRLLTSTRANNAIEECVKNAEPLELFLLPYDRYFHPKNEYRVFCRPGDLKITAISQYRWHQPWRLADWPKVIQTPQVQGVLKGARDLRRQILATLNDEAGPWTGTKEKQIFVKQGFTFDLLYTAKRDKQDGKVGFACELVELNVFGARSNCGACLFNWVRDWKILYGEEGSRSEFRVSTPKSGKNTGPDAYPTEEEIKRQGEERKKAWQDGTCWKWRKNNPQQEVEESRVLRDAEKEERL